jgi:hypothetical protein
MVGTIFNGVLTAPDPRFVFQTGGLNSTEVQWQWELFLLRQHYDPADTGLAASHRADRSWVRGHAAAGRHVDELHRR